MTARIHDSPIPADGTLLRVRFAETDQMGVAHHSAYAVWLEAARVEWLRELGLSYRDLEASGISLAVSELQVRYRLAAFFDDELLVQASLTELRSRRCRFAYSLHRPADGKLIATAATVHTPVDASGRAVQLPREWLASLRRQERPGSATTGRERTG
jgi:acyl-CoA thioester hydrolase